MAEATSDHTDTPPQPPDGSNTAGDAEDTPNQRSSRPRRRRWDNPVSALQAARYHRQWILNEAAAHIRAACHGHRSGACKLLAGRLSDWEHGKTEHGPSVAHITAMCTVYQTGPEDLGLITWRTPHQRRQAQQAHHARVRAQVIADLAALADLAARTLAPQPADGPTHTHGSTEADTTPILSGDGIGDPRPPHAELTLAAIPEHLWGSRPGRWPHAT